jgi:membrane protease YdiL (CAAX protease family)
MSENNGNQIIGETKESEVKTAELPKKVRVGFVFLSLVPAAVFLAIQTMTQMPFIILAAADVYRGEVASNVANPSDVTENLTALFSEKYGIYAYLLYSIVGIIVFGIWYYKGFVKKGPKVKPGQIFGVKSVIAVLGFGIGFYFVINALLNIIEILMPAVIADYNQTMETVGLGSDMVITIVYAIVLGPIIEELVFRGVIFAFLEKSGIKPVWIIVVTSALFGLVHVYPVQVLYAAILGLFLGFMRYKYRSILITIPAHMLLNLMGTLGEMALEQFNLSNGVLFILGGVSLILIVFLIVLVNSDKKAVRVS